MAGLGHAHIYSFRLPSTWYVVQIKTKSYHALANRYVVSYNQKMQHEGPSPATFPIYLNFVSHKTSRTPGNIKKMDEIKDLYIAIRQSVFEYCPVLLMAFTGIDALEHKIEIWVSYCRLVSKVTPNTLILSEDGIVFPSTEMDIGRLPNLLREIHWNLSGFASR